MGKVTLRSITHNLQKKLRNLSHEHTNWHQRFSTQRKLSRNETLSYTHCLILKKCCWKIKNQPLNLNLKIQSHSWNLKT